MNVWNFGAAPPVVSDDGLDLLLARAAQLDEGLESPRPKHLQLTEAQRKFAVNPSYRSFFDPSLKEAEDRQAADEGEPEVPVTVRL